MKGLNDYRMRLVLVGVVATLVFGSGSVKADFTFGEPIHLEPPISNSAGSDAPDCIIDDGLTLYFDSWRPSGYGMYDIWVTTRSTKDDPWGEPVNLGPQINSSVQDICATITADCLELYFSSYRSGGYGQCDMYVAKRDTRDDEWSSPMNLGPTLNGTSNDLSSWVSPDGLELYLFSNRPGGFGGYDIWVTTRATRNDPWEVPMNAGSTVNSTAHEGYPFISADELALFFSEEIDAPFRPGGFGRGDMWMAKRTSVSEPWGTPVNLGSSVNSSSYDGGPRITPDGSTLYFCSARPGSLGGSYGDIYEARIIPIVDFNGDGIVDADDMCIMVDHWGTDYSLCDIGPMPWGDGIVDVQDLIVLSEHLFEDYRLVAHWTMDEDAGNTAYDSAGKYDATLQGGPSWQPTGGKVSGSLQFDGVDDYVSTPFILNPNKGSFSVTAWIKGGAPGQVIISQSDLGRDQGNTWLLADASYGRLMTRLMHPPFPPLVSESVITDDQWHHVGLVFDFMALYRYLYVDGIEVAKDSDYVAGVGSDGALIIGADKTLDAASFFSGLIDDVRIYNNVLSAEEIATLVQ